MIYYKAIPLFLLLFAAPCALGQPIEGKAASAAEIEIQPLIVNGYNTIDDQIIPVSDRYTLNIRKTGEGYLLTVVDAHGMVSDSCRLGADFTLDEQGVIRYALDYDRGVEYRRRVDNRGRIGITDSVDYHTVLAPMLGRLNSALDLLRKKLAESTPPQADSLHRVYDLNQIIDSDQSKAERESITNYYAFFVWWLFLEDSGECFEVSVTSAVTDYDYDYDDFESGKHYIMNNELEAIFSPYVTAQTREAQRLLSFNDHALENQEEREVDLDTLVRQLIDREQFIRKYPSSVYQESIRDRVTSMYQTLSSARV